MTSDRLIRIREGRILGGACAGLGHRTGIDPLVFRVGFGLLAFASWVGLPLYGLAMVLMPDEDGEPSPLERLTNRTFAATTALTLLGVLLCAGVLLSLTGQGLVNGLSGDTLAALSIIALIAMTAQVRGVDLVAAVRTLPDRLRGEPLPAAQPSAPPTELPSEELQAEWIDLATLRPFRPGPPLKEADVPAAPAKPAGATAPIDLTKPTTAPATAETTAPSGATAFTGSTAPDTSADASAPEGSTAPSTSARAFVPGGSTAPGASAETSAPGETTKPGISAETSAPGETPAPSGATTFAGSTVSDAPVGASVSGGATAPAGGCEGALERVGKRPPVLAGVTLLLAAGAGASSLLFTSGLTGIVTLQVACAVALAVVALGLLVGARAGGTGGLFATGALLSVVLIGSGTVADVQDGARFGGVTWRPVDLDTTQPYRIIAGQGRLDLTALPLRDGERHRVSAEVDLGGIRVEVPALAQVELRVSTDLGDITVDRQITGGPRARVERTLPGVGDDPPVLELHLKGRFSDLEVVRAQA